MKNTEALNLDIQFFAEEGSETPEAAAPEVASDEGTEIESEGEEEVETAPAQQSSELNSQFASVRRRAEAEAKKKADDLNRRFAGRFAGITNPETGAPINTAEEYLEALAAQDRMQAKAKMQEAGIDPSMLDRAIANSPAVRRAEELARQNQAYQAQAMIDEDMKAIIDFDPTITSAADVYAQPNFNEVIGYCQNHPGTRLCDAYKLVNFDRLSEARLKAGEQAAINQAKSKDHLRITTGTNDKDKSVDIPSEVKSMWMAAYPDKSAKELKALYNETLRRTGG